MTRLLAAFAAFSLLAAAAPAQADHTYSASYAQDRAEIEDLQARYLFAIDYFDWDAYVATFAEDGVLDWAGGIVRGREAIREECHGMRTYFANRGQGEAPTRPPRLQHFITSVVITVKDDRASSRSLWFEIDNDTRLRTPYVGGYGHYEDELRRVNGRWLISHHQVFNEQRENMASGATNPAW
jgi:hypothetical protein